MITVLFTTFCLLEVAYVPSLILFPELKKLFQPFLSVTCFKISFHACFFSSQLLHVDLHLLSSMASSWAQPSRWTLTFPKKKQLASCFLVKDAALILEWDLFSSLCNLLNLCSVYFVIHFNRPISAIRNNFYVSCFSFTNT